MSLFSDNFQNNKYQLSLESFIDDLNSDKYYYNFSPEFQRNYVWTEKESNLFLDSIFNNIDSSEIIFSKNKIKNKKCYVNIDGKQRCLTLIKFFNNEMPYNKNNIKYYYSKSPTSSKLTTVLSDSDREIFNNKLISLNIYNNLSYSKQVEIFQRVNKGVSLSEGEKATAYFNKQDEAEKFNKICSDFNTYFSKFFDLKNRDEHKKIILRMIHNFNNGNKAYNTRTIEKYIRDKSYKNEMMEILEKFHINGSYILSNIRFDKIKEYLTNISYVEISLVKLFENYEEHKYLNSTQITKLLKKMLIELDDDKCSTAKTNSNWSSLFSKLRSYSLH